MDVFNSCFSTCFFSDPKSLISSKSILEGLLLFGHTLPESPFVSVSNSRQLLLGFPIRLRCCGRF